MKFFFLRILTFASLIVLITIILGGGFGDKDQFSLLNQGEPIVFAHRGVIDNNVENSIEAFKKSKFFGFNAIETDISTTKDGKLIVFHDKNCKKLLGINSNINQLNWNDIKNKNLIYKSQITKNKIITLDQLLKWIDEDIILYLDIKETSKSIADSLLQSLKINNRIKNVIVADDNILFLKYIQFKIPELKTALEGFNKGKEWLYYIIPKNMKPHYYSSFIDQVDINHIEFLNKNNLLKNKITYGVDSTNINEVYEFGIKNIIVDYYSSMLLPKQLKDSLSDKK